MPGSFFARFWTMLDNSDCEPADTPAHRMEEDSNDSSGRCARGTGSDTDFVGCDILRDTRYAPLKMRGISLRAIPIVNDRRGPMQSTMNNAKHTVFTDLTTP
ncbi:hypothetical protein ETB97_003406 [Aspergillus alliaceus]|uniref:Uncharacterized protein n=1 Tax=Petromyces alliaceus TaxID=209559 RepID=A0A8H6EAI3_PETAA|nr:hypothetical protein ETB97_003406 [Aspergillus burnettii]